MDKASSLFLDQFAVDKLLEKKLEKVSHTPGPSFVIPPLEELNEKMFSLKEAGFLRKAKIITFHSAVKSPYPENNLCRVHVYTAEEEKDRLIFVHGLYEENRTMYDFLFMLLNRKGYTIYLFVLPYHYERKPDTSVFSGELFWSADLERSVRAFLQAAKDIYLLYLYLKEKEENYPHLCGFSIGGAVIFNIAAAAKIKSGILLCNPAMDLVVQLWTSKLLVTIKRDLIENGRTEEDLKKALSVISPICRKGMMTDEKKVKYIIGEYDHIANYKDTIRFFAPFKSVSKNIYKCGHLNMVRVPRLSEDIDQFLSTVIKE